jgi:hypothetical protein
MKINITFAEIRKKIAIGRKVRKVFFFIDFFMYQSKRFKIDRYKYFHNLKNKYQGKRVFIIGNGPSLTKDDLNQLSGEICLAANKIFLIFEQTEWRPDYYFIEDELHIERCIDQVNAFEDIPVMSNNRVWNNPPFKKAYLYNLIKDDISQCSPAKFGTDPIQGFYAAGNIVYTMIQFACYMGFKDIYLLGVDFNYFQNSDNPYTYDAGKCSQLNYFHKDYAKEGELNFVPNLECSLIAFQMAEETTRNSKIKIFNATRGGKLEVFERVVFDEVVTS